MEVADAKGFTLRTPTAVVTDLGTEFGVEVDKEGSTTSHVFRGAVNVRPVNHDKDANVADTVLRANESVRIERASDDSQRIVVRRVVAKPGDFVRRLQDTPSSSVDVLAWFRMGEDDPNARAGEPADKEIHDHNRRNVRLNRCGSPTYSADTEAPASSLAMTFHSEKGGECFRSPRFGFVPTDYFIFEAWVKMQKLGSEIQLVAANGTAGKNGYCLAAIDGRWFFVLEGMTTTELSRFDSGVPCAIGQWTHLALVCERGKSRLWIDGRPVGQIIDVLASVPEGPFTIGGSAEYPERVFNGEIDEVRLSTFIAPFRPEMLLLRKTEPSK
jgi:hypothetical protein